MKVVVINFSGNTGKTTLSKHLLVPQLGGARRISIEDVNAGDGPADLEIAAARFSKLAAELNVADEAEHFVIDVGASNAKAMVEHFAKLRTTRAGIDWWVIPVVPRSKQLADSLATAAALRELDVPAERIVLLPNMVEDLAGVDGEGGFGPVLKAKARGFVVPDQWVLSNEVFERLKNSDETVFSMVQADIDWKAEKAAAKGDAKKLAAVGERMVIRDMCESAADNLRAVFKSMPLSAVATV